MTWRLFMIELRHWFRQPLMYSFFGLFAFMGFSLVVWDAIKLGGAGGNLYRNAPYMVYVFYSVIAFLGLLLVAAFVNASAIRDFENNTSQIIFSTPLRKSQYLLSRFLGSTFIATLPMLGISLGMIIGTWMPWVDAETIGPNNLMAHLQAYLYLTVPNIVFSAAIIFSVAILTRSTVASFITAIVIMVGSGVTSTLTSELDNRTVAALLDPFGGTAFDIVSRYWTVDEKNTLMLPMHGVFLWNRLLWLGVSAAVFAFGYWRFSFTDRASAKPASLGAEAMPLSNASVMVPTVTRSYGTAARLKQFRRIAWSDYLGMLKGTAFIIVMLVGLVLMSVNLAFASSLYENKLLPVTYNTIESVKGSFQLFTIILITFYSGLLVWKEREPRLDEIHDATPIPLGLGVIAKYSALLLLLSTVLLITSIAGMLSQLLRGYTHLELDVYLGYYILPGLFSFGVLGALSMLIHVLVNNKYVGYATFIGVFALNIILWSTLDVVSNLVSLNSAPRITFSGMNRYGTALHAWLWFKAYWWAFASVAMVITLFFWVRGKETSMRWRMRLAAVRAVRHKWIALPALVAWIGLGAWNYYNTKVLNTYTTSDEQEDDAAYYEKTYKKYEGILQPHYTDITFTIDLDPAQRSLKSVAEVTVQNKGDRSIDSLHLLLGSDIEQEIEMAGGQMVLDDERVDYRIYKLTPPLAPGAELHFKVIATHAEKGFENDVTVMQINNNGTFFNNMDILPRIGYEAGGELQDKGDRKDHELRPKDRMIRLSSDPAKRMQNYLMANSDWVNVRTTISTSPDQIAIAPGSLTKEWTENGKRYFHYEVDHKSMNFYSFLSARYEVKREKWKGVDVEVYYDKAHATNVPRMVNSMKKALAYYTEHFGPYMHKQTRIIEFPRYQTFAQAFPGTMPYSESIGFIADFSDTTDLDMTFYVVAHEMGHQWWAHQVIGADMQGSTLFSESMAQYSALMVMENEFGRAHMRKFLKLESDKYQQARGGEQLKEVPLLEVENQGYVHYNKASVVLYGLRDFVGEDSLNKAFRAFADSFAYAEPPYPTALDFYREIEMVVPDSLEYLLVDGFKKITLYNNRIDESTARMLPDSTYEVKLKINGEKNYADSLGHETKAEMNDWMDISILRFPAFGKKADKSKNDIPLVQKRLRLKGGVNEFTFIVDAKPMQAVVDRDNLFFDRVMQDNVKKVELQK
jgi:ABC-2 type transport system permease protein